MIFSLGKQIKVLIFSITISFCLHKMVWNVFKINGLINGLELVDFFSICVLKCVQDDL